MSIGHALTNCEKCWTDAGLVKAKTGQRQDQAYFNLYVGRRFNPCSYEEQTGTPAVEMAAEVERTELSDDDMAVLAIEDNYWSKAGERLFAAKTILGLTPTKYAAALNRLIDMPAALMVSPITVHRLRIQRETAVTMRARWAR